MSARGRNTRLIGSSSSSYSGQSSSSPRADCSPDGTRSARSPHSARQAAVFSPTAAILSPENARVQTVVLELLLDRLDGVHRGERDPLVAALHEPTDRLVHLQRIAGRLDR